MVGGSGGPPHPDPLPKERENRQPVFEEAMVHGSNARFLNDETLHEPTGKHAAPTELISRVHGPNACAKRKEALYEP
jgi:hypothetical protein